jgi:hypothetical protein
MESSVVIDVLLCLRHVASLNEFISRRKYFSYSVQSSGHEVTGRGNCKMFFSSEMATSLILLPCRPPQTFDRQSLYAQTCNGRDEWRNWYPRLVSDTGLPAHNHTHLWAILSQNVIPTNRRSYKQQCVGYVSAPDFKRNAALVSVKFAYFTLCCSNNRCKNMNGTIIPVLN